MIYTTKNRIKSTYPCTGAYQELVTLMGLSYPEDEPIGLDKILIGDDKINYTFTGVYGIVWCLAIAEPQEEAILVWRKLGGYLVDKLKNLLSEQEIAEYSEIFTLLEQYKDIGISQTKKVFLKTAINEIRSGLIQNNESAKEMGWASVKFNLDEFGWTPFHNIIEAYNIAFPDQDNEYLIKEEAKQVLIEVFNAL